MLLLLVASKERLVIVPEGLACRKFRPGELVDSIDDQVRLASQFVGDFVDLSIDAGRMFRQGLLLASGEPSLSKLVVVAAVVVAVVVVVVVVVNAGRNGRRGWELSIGNVGSGEEVLVVRGAENKVLRREPVEGLVDLLLLLCSQHRLGVCDPALAHLVGGAHGSTPFTIAQILPRSDTFAKSIVRAAGSRSGVDSAGGEDVRLKSGHGVDRRGGGDRRRLGEVLSRIDKLLEVGESTIGRNVDERGGIEEGIHSHGFGEIGARWLHVHGVHGRRVSPEGAHRTNRRAIRTRNAVGAVDTSVGAC